MRTLILDTQVLGRLSGDERYVTLNGTAWLSAVFESFACLSANCFPNDDVRHLNSRKGLSNLRGHRAGVPASATIAVISIQ